MCFVISKRFPVNIFAVLNVMTVVVKIPKLPKTLLPYVLHYMKYLYILAIVFCCGEEEECQDQNKAKRLLNSKK